MGPPNGQPIDSRTIVTTVANSHIHAPQVRMPVIQAHADYDVWLDSGVCQPERLQPLSGPNPSEEMVAYPISTRVNNPANGISERTESPP